jgi:hypothetical protein
MRGLLPRLTHKKSAAHDPSCAKQLMQQDTAISAGCATWEDSQ